MKSDASESRVALDERSLQVRRLVLRALAGADKGHVGSALSLIEIFRVLYERVVKHNPKDPAWSERDRVILSKGHGCLALYAALADQGYFPLSTLDTVCERGAPLGGHPERHLGLGIEASTGALGHGLPIAVGMALAHQKKGSGVRIFVIVGDGELNEGSNWEALLIASKHHLNNLVLIVDHNGQQLHGSTALVAPLEPLRQKLESFGACVHEADGHSMAQLSEAFDRVQKSEPKKVNVVICHTIKGKGLVAAEHNPAWHYKRTFGEKGIQEIANEWAAPSARQSALQDQ